MTDHHTRISCAKDETIFLQGSPADVTFFVLNGLVKLYCPLPGGGRIFVRLVGAGELLGHADFVDSWGRPRQLFEARAHARCTLALFTRECLRRLGESLDQSMLLRQMAVLNTAWSSVLHWYAVFLGMSFRERLELCLQDLGARFGVKERGGILLLPELSHEDLAEMIQSSRPMVSRLVSDMIEEGTLERRGRQYVLLGAELVNQDEPEGLASMPMGFPFLTRPHAGLASWPRPSRH